MKVYLAMCYYYSFGSYGIYTDNWIINVYATEELAEKVIRGYKCKGWIFRDELKDQIELHKAAIDKAKRLRDISDSDLNDMRIFEEAASLVAVEEIESKSEIWIRHVEPLDKENKKGWNFYIKEEEVLE